MAVLTASAWRSRWCPQLTGTGEDTLITTLIGSAEARVAAYLGYPHSAVGTEPTVEDVAYTRYYSGDLDVEPPGRRMLRLDVLPVVSITSIYDDPDLDFDAEELVDSSDYTLHDAQNGLVLLDSDAAHGGWEPGRRNIKATYTAGYATVPDRLVQAVGMVVLHHWRLRFDQGQSNTAQTGGSASLREEELPEEVKLLLDPLRLPRAIL